MAEHKGEGWFVTTVKVGQKLSVGPEVQTVISQIRGGQIRIAVKAPRDWKILKDRQTSEPPPKRAAMPLVDEQGQPTARGLIMQAIGQSSAFWSNLEGAGTFDASQASRVGDNLLLALRDLGMDL